MSGISQSSCLTEILAMEAILNTQAEQLAYELATQVSMPDDLNGLMRTLVNTALERMFNTEAGCPPRC